MYKLLVIEDEELIRKGICSLVDFEKMDVDRVFEAENGLVAWDIIESERPHIILSDINIPYLDGINLAKMVKDRYPETRIVFLTGYDYFDYAISALKLGADDYILKPISKKDVEEILIKVSNKLDKERKERAVQSILDNSLKNKNSKNNDGNISTDMSDDLSKLDHSMENIQDKKGLDIEAIINSELTNPDLSLAYLADRLGFSSNYLSLLIKKNIGLSFQDYVGRQRMEKAKILLLTTDMKIYEIAQSIGYEDVNYFSSKFKQIVGSSPRQYQKGVV